MINVLYTTSDGVFNSVQFLTPAFEVKRSSDIQIPSNGDRLTIVGGDGYRHHDTLDLVRKINLPITYIHIDAHTDRFGDQDSVQGSVNCANFTFEISRLPQIKEIVYLGTDTRVIVNEADDLIDLLKNCRIYSCGFPANFSRKVFKDFIDWEDIPAFDEDAIKKAYMNRYKKPELRSDLEALLIQNNSVKEYTVGQGSFFKYFLSINFFYVNDFKPETIQTDAVYVSIDVDVLRREEGIPIGEKFSTGSLTIEDLLRILSLIGKAKKIVGIDVHGINLQAAKPDEKLLSLFSGITNSYQTHC